MTKSTHSQGGSHLFLCFTLNFYPKNPKSSRQLGLSRWFRLQHPNPTSPWTPLPLHLVPTHEQHWAYPLAVGVGRSWQHSVLRQKKISTVVFTDAKSASRYPLTFPNYIFSVNTSYLYSCLSTPMCWFPSTETVRAPFVQMDRRGNYRWD